MDSIFSAITVAKYRVIDGDFIDRLHSKYSVILIAGIMIVLGLQNTGASSIICWTPGHFTDEQTDYTHQLCWVNSTYYYPTENDADKFPLSNKHVIPYYQFIFFILFAQAFLFILPTFLWKKVSADSRGYLKKALDQVEKSKVVTSGVNSTKLDEPKEEKDIELENKEEPLKGQPPLSTLNEIADRFEKSTVKIQDDPERGFDINDLDSNKSSLFSAENNTSILSPDLANTFVDMFTSLLPKNRKIQDERLGKDPRGAKVVDFMKPIKGAKNLTWHYLILKLYNLVNVIFQITMLHVLFGAEFYRYGIEMFYKLWSSEDPFFLSKQFPVISFCDFFVHQNLRQLYWNTVQCLLYVNIYIEKFYVIIWFWYVFLLIVTFFNIVSWISEIFILNRYSFLIKYLTIRRRMFSNDSDRKAYSFGKEKRKKTKQILNLDRETIVRFRDEFLGNDGFVMLQLVKAVSGDIVFMELLHELWTSFNSSYYNNQSLAYN